MIPFRLSCLPGLLLAFLAAAPAGLAAAPPYDDFRLTTLATGLNGPTAIVEAPDGSGRLFVLEQWATPDDLPEGRVRIIDATGTLLPTPYLRQPMSGGVSNEQGLLGIAFDPDFAHNGTLYITYTAPASDPRLGSVPDQVLKRLVATDPSADVFAGSQQDVLRIPDIYWNHNGGNIVFGPDGHLYWGMGDGGSGGDPNGFSQDLWKKTVSGRDYYLLGKMLRLDVRNPTAAAPANQCGATPGQPAPYSIPADNPYAGAGDRCGEIWLHGLRNPWRWSFDRKTGDLWIGDVGQNYYEEVDLRAAGDAGNRNYGWAKCEGFHYYSPSGPGLDCPQTTGTVAPVLEYPHAYGCSITGGYRYRGPVASLQGEYLFSDYCAGGLRAAREDTGGWSWEAVPLPAGSSLPGVFSFGEDLSGNLYVISGNGNIWRLDPDGVPTYTVTPQAGAHGALLPAVPQQVPQGGSTHFTLVPDSGYVVDAVSGCGGSLLGLVWTTGPVTADCTVTARFRAGDILFANGFE